MANAPRSIPPSPGRRPAGPSGGGSRTPLFVGLGVVAVVVVALVAALALRGGDDGGSVAAGGAVPTGEGTSPTQPVTVTGAALPPFEDASPDPAVGLVAPTLAGATFDGSAVTLTPGDGRPKLVVFLTHWCPHCQKEVPVLVDWMAEGRAPANLDVVAVSTASDPGRGNFPPQEWLAGEGWPQRVLADNATSEAATAYGLQSFPYLVVLDADGTVVARAAGEQGADQLDALVAPVR